jgi:hypothetical protein
MKPKNGKKTIPSIISWKGVSIASGIAVTLLVLYCILPLILQYCLHDPLSGPIRTKLNHMDAIGQEIKDLTARAKKFNDTSALTEVQREYEELERSFNQVLQNGRESIELNSVGKNYHDLEAALDKIEPGEVVLRDHLTPISRPVMKAGLDLDFIWKALREGNQRWTDLITARGNMNDIAIEQLNQMKLPDWEKIPVYSGLF